MTDGPRLLWPDPLALTPEILHGALEGWGIPPSWGRLDASVWTRLYKLDSSGRAVTRGTDPQVVAIPPPGYQPEVIDSAFWNRLKWGFCEAADLQAVYLEDGTTRHVAEITSTPWNTGGRLKPTWAELRKIVVTWWLGAAAAQLLDESSDESVDHAVRWVRDRTHVALPFGVRAKPRSLVHLREIQAVDGVFPKTVLLGAAGAKVQITSEADARTLAAAATAASNRLETARNLLAEEALVQVRKVADETGGLAESASDVARLNARTRAMNEAHRLLGADTIDAQFARHLPAA